jgi:hypothetical protein
MTYVVEVFRTPHDALTGVGYRGAQRFLRLGTRRRANSTGDF